jgi:hypothetical protein
MIISFLKFKIVNRNISRAISSSLLALAILSGCTNISIKNDNKSQGGNVGNVTSQQSTLTGNSRTISILWTWLYISVLIIIILMIYALKQRTELKRIQNGLPYKENLDLSQKLNEMTKNCAIDLVELAQSRRIKPYIDNLIEEIEKFIETIDSSERKIIEDRLDVAKALAIDLENRMGTIDSAKNNFQRKEDRTRGIIEKMFQKRNLENDSESED